MLVEAKRLEEWSEEEVYQFLEFKKSKLDRFSDSLHQNIKTGKDLLNLTKEKLVEMKLPLNAASAILVILEHKQKMAREFEETKKAKMPTSTSVDVVSDHMVDGYFEGNVSNKHVCLANLENMSPAEKTEAFKKLNNVTSIGVGSSLNVKGRQSSITDSSTVMFG